MSLIKQNEFCSCKERKAKCLYECVNSWFSDLNNQPFETLPYHVKYAWFMCAMRKKQHNIGNAFLSFNDIQAEIMPSTQYQEEKVNRDFGCPMPSLD